MCEEQNATESIELAQEAALHTCLTLRRRE